MLSHKPETGFIFYSILALVPQLLIGIALVCRPPTALSLHLRLCFRFLVANHSSGLLEISYGHEAMVGCRQITDLWNGQLHAFFSVMVVERW